MVTAFIPARGGSRSIPLKNIVPLGGRPLIWWSIKALAESGCVDRIVVATDSDRIDVAVRAFPIPGVSIYRRKPENATDTASTESVMLEWLECEACPDSDTIILVQATSPLTRPDDFKQALGLFREGRFDSVLSCVRCKRFFWSPFGTSINYDYQHRPMRQAFDGYLMENGAFYIACAGNIRQWENRLGGRIGVYEMPAWTATEIDEPEDLIVVENLLRRYGPHYPSSVKLFVTDVDGTMTDGGIFYSRQGEAMKKFNTRDAHGMMLLQQRGIKTGMLTSGTGEITAARARKLKVDFFAQVTDKLKALQDYCALNGFSLSEVAYIGDDLGCLPVLERVGYPGCPSDADPAIRSLPGIHITRLKGGKGCVREFIESLPIKLG